MFARHHLSARGRAVELVGGGQIVTTVVTATGASKSVISRFKITADGGNALQTHAGGRRRIVTPQEDRYVSLVVKRNRNGTPNQIAAHLAIIIGTHISARTISLR